MVNLHSVCVSSFIELVRVPGWRAKTIVGGLRVRSHNSSLCLLILAPLGAPSKLLPARQPALNCPSSVRSSSPRWLSTSCQCRRPRGLMGWGCEARTTAGPSGPSAPAERIRADVARGDQVGGGGELFVLGWPMGGFASSLPMREQEQEQDKQWPIESSNGYCNARTVSLRSLRPPRPVNSLHTGQWSVAHKSPASCGYSISIKTRIHDYCRA